MLHHCTSATRPLPSREMSSYLPTPSRPLPSHLILSSPPHTPLQTNLQPAVHQKQNGSNSEFSNSQDGFPNSGGGGGGGAAEAVPAINPSPHARKVAAGIAPPPSSITSESSNAGTRKRKQANPKQNPPTKAARKQVQTQQEYSESGGGGVDAWTIGRSKPPHQAEQHAAIFRPESEQSKSKYKKLFHRRQRQR